MKLFLVVAFCVATAYGKYIFWIIASFWNWLWFSFSFTKAAPATTDVSAVLTKAQDLITQTQQIISGHKEHNRGHLLSNLEYQLARFQKVEYDLKVLSQLVPAPESVAKDIQNLENKLGYFEDRLGEELAFVEDVYKSSAATGAKSPNELLDYALALMMEAKAAVAKFAQAKEHSEAELQIHSELFQVKMLYNELNHMAVTSILGESGTKLLEEQLVVHERSLHRLILLL